MHIYEADNDNFVMSTTGILIVPKKVPRLARVLIYGKPERVVRTIWEIRGWPDGAMKVAAG